MNHIQCDVAIIGAGTAGLAAYAAATKAGAHAIVIEHGPGGTTCARVGCMPSKALIAAAHAAHAARQAPLFGVQTGDIVIDGAAVMDRVRRERDYFTGAVLDGYHDIPVDRRPCGRAQFVAPDRLRIGDETEITARAIVIAVGSAPTLPDLLQPISDRVHTSDTIFDLPHPPATLAVLGAGALGLELAAAFARLGTRVTVIDRAGQVGNIVDPDAAVIARRLLSADIDFRLGAELDRAERQDGGVRLAWNGDAAGDAVFECVLAAAGRPPSLPPLALDAMGLALDDHGVPHFDAETGRCGDSMIFIAGDARACRPVLHEASRTGTLAGRNAARPDDLRRTPPPPSLSVIFTDPQIALVGTAHDALPAGAITATADFADNGRVHLEARSDGTLRLYANRAGTLLGATIVGPDAEQVAHLVAMALTQRLTLQQLADQVYYHPTVAEVLQQAARAGAAQVAPA